jgi:hypothetical protein
VALPSSSVAVVDVHHVRGLDERVVEIPVRGVERMVDLEATAVLGPEPVDDNFPVEDASIATGRVVAEDGGTDQRTQFPRSRPGMSSRPSAMHEQAAGLAAHEVALLEPVMAVDSAKLRPSAAYRMRS